MTGASESRQGDERAKLGMMLLSGFSIAATAGIAAGAIHYRIPNDSQTLLGVIVGGLLLYSRECVQAVRAIMQDAKTGVLTDHLARSNPTNDNTVPEDAAEAARMTADAADKKAGQIEEKVA